MENISRLKITVRNVIIRFIIQLRLILFPYRKEHEKMGIHAYRISFTTEQGPQVKQILHLYEKIFLNGEKSLQELYTGEYTGGHYKRGVE